MAAKQTAPARLGAKARKLWKGLTDTFELRPDELRILEDACREVDLIERLETSMVKADLVVTGSMGQPVANPMLQELRLHRSVLRTLLRALDLPEEEGADQSRSSSGRSLAMVRWGRGA